MLKYKNINQTQLTRVLHISLFFSALTVLLTMTVHKNYASNQYDTNTYANAQDQKIHSKNGTYIGNPTRLQIPKLGIDTFVQNMGVTDVGAMETPNNSYEVGWFKLGPKPGERGSAVIAGHYDESISSSGIFANLHLLEKGDPVYTIDSLGHTHTFIVRQSELFDKGYAERVFSTNDAAHLNLVTCIGAWDTQSNQYTNRLVVFTDLAI